MRFSNIVTLLEQVVCRKDMPCDPFSDTNPDGPTWQVCSDVDVFWNLQKNTVQRLPDRMDSFQHVLLLQTSNDTRFSDHIPLPNSQPQKDEGSINSSSQVDKHKRWRKNSGSPTVHWKEPWPQNSKKRVRHGVSPGFIQGGAPQVISWFIIPLIIDISPINHSYWSYKPTWLSRGHHIVPISNYPWFLFWDRSLLCFHVKTLWRFHFLHHDVCSRLPSRQLARSQVVRLI
jgi:hypothetical protein